MFEHVSIDQAVERDFFAGQINIERVAADNLDTSAGRCLRRFRIQFDSRNFDTPSNQLRFGTTVPTANGKDPSYVRRNVGKNVVANSIIISVYGHDHLSRL